MAQLSGGGRLRHNGGGVVWSDDEYRAFTSADKESHRRDEAFRDVLADVAGTALTTSQASGTAGITPSPLREALGEFSMCMGAAITNMQRSFGWAHGEDLDPSHPAEFHYSMTLDQAGAWTSNR